MAMLSAAWTVHAVNAPAAVPVQTLAKSSSTPPAADDLVVPSQPPQSPVSVSSVPAPSTDDTLSAGRAANRPAVLGSPAAGDAIPAVALAAYQRAATVIDTADHGCHLDWQLLAAIGQVESHHGSAGGNTLTPTGVATPGIFGPRLTGKHHTAKIIDTDGGGYDRDRRYDRAVGPMQFLPATWSAVGVDADGDGKRDPQDLNDAALAAAVYLCSGADDLATSAGQHAAVLRYNQSKAYVARVLSIAAAYRSAGSLPVSLRTVDAVDLGTDPTRLSSTDPAETDDSRPTGTRHSQQGTGHRHASGGLHIAAVQPDSGRAHSAAHPTTAPAKTPSPTQSATGAASPASDADLRTLCDDQIDADYPDATQDASRAAVEECVTELTGQTLDDAQAKVADVVAALAAKIAGLTGDPEVSDPPAESTPSDPTPSQTPPGSPSASPSQSSSQAAGDQPTSAD